MDGLTEGPVREPSGYRCRHLLSFSGHEGDDGDIGNGAVFSGQLARAVKFMGPVLEIWPTTLGSAVCGSRSAAAWLVLLMISAVCGARVLYWLDFRENYNYGIKHLFIFWKGWMALYGGVVYNGPRLFLVREHAEPPVRRETCTKREAAILDPNVYLYLLLFLIAVGLFVRSLLRREKGGNPRRDDRGASEVGTEEPGEGDQRE